MENLSFTIRVLRTVIDIGERVLEKSPGADWIKYKGYRFESSRVPEAFDGFRFVVLADVHAHLFGKQSIQLIQAVKSCHPEVILSVGDWIRTDYSGRDVKILRDMVEGIVKIAPLYTILGNHEGRADHKNELIREFTALGVRILQDENILLGREGTEEKIVLTGLYPSYENSFYGSLRESGIGPKIREEYENVMRDVPDKKTFQIVLSHRPELFELYADLKMDLVFSGHAHGGLMKLPGGKRLLAPDQGLLPDYTHGAYQKSQTTMIVSEGLGGPRIGIRPQIIVGELKRKESQNL